MGALPKPKFLQPAQGQTCRQASLRMAVSGLLTLFCTAGYEHKQDKGNRMFIIFSKPHILLIEGKTGKERRKENDSKGMEIGYSNSKTTPAPAFMELITYGEADFNQIITEINMYSQTLRSNIKQGTQGPEEPTPGRVTSWRSHRALG